MLDTVIVVCPRQEFPEARLLDLPVAGLRVLQRLLLTAHQAGFGRILVIADAEQQTRLRPQVAGEPRTTDGVEWVESVESPAIPARGVLVLPPSVVPVAGSLRVWRSTGDAPNLVAIPVGDGVLVAPCEPGELAGCLAAGRDGSAGLEGFWAGRPGRGEGTPVPREGTDAFVLRSSADIRTIERGMLRALRTADDGLVVDRYVNRALSERLSRLLVRLPVTPNQITVASLLTGLLAAWVLHLEGTVASLIGLLLFQTSVVFDHVDGEIARLKFQFSRLGKWLDNFSDHGVDLAVVACLAWRGAAGEHGGWLPIIAALAALGVTGSFLVVFCWTLHASRDAMADASRPAVDAMMVMANRDGFSLALWATILIGRPMWFLWILAIGSNLFWIFWLMLCGLPRRPKPAGGPTGS